MALPPINLAQYMDSPEEIASQNMFRIPELYQQMKASNIANQRSEILNKYLGQQEQNKNELLAAQAELARQNAALLPQKFQMMQDKQQYLKKRFGGAYQVKQALSSMSPAAKAAWIAKNPKAYSAMLTQLGNMALQSSPADQMSQVNDNPNMPAHTVASKVVNSGVMGEGATPVFHEPTPEQVSLLQRASELSANKYLTTGGTQRQLEGGAQVESLINSPVFNSQAQDAANFAGAIGSGKASLAALSQKNPKAYEGYIQFKNVTMPLFLNRVKSLDAMGATDKQSEILHNMYYKTMDSLTSNPKQFLSQLNMLKSTMSNVYNSIKGSANPLFDVQRRISVPATNEKIAMPGSSDKETDVPSGNVMVVSPSGVKGHIPASQLSDALKQGYKKWQK